MMLKNPDHSIITRLNDPDFQKQNFAHNKQLFDQFKLNTCHVMRTEGIPIALFFRLLNNAGCKISRTGWIDGDRNNSPNSLVLTTFSRILDVDITSLASVDFQDTYKYRGK